MVGIPKESILNQVTEIPHGRDKTISKSCHVSHTCLISRLCHGLGFLVIHGNGLFTQHMLTSGNGRLSNRAMEKIRRGDDDGIHILSHHHFLKIRRPHSDTRLSLSTLQGLSIGITQGCQASPSAHRNPRKMVLKRDASASYYG